ncbi:MAG: NYN domain-containing protein [Lachnospiraceae bacterium]|nr:NYN domain-containing protein [Lachnospiraceae bacterium]
MKRFVVGILAHVDAGKTTLSESLLYLSGEIRKLGRVDHKNTFLDHNELERQRGITIFSKQAWLKYDDMELQLLDTPGHVDFSAEMERTLQILDYAIVVISGTDLVQGHTEMVFRLLARYQVPAFLFVNKMDLSPFSKEEILEELRKRLSEQIIDFTKEEFSSSDYEIMAMSEESLLEQYLESGTINKEQIKTAIARRGIFPCYFGSALKMEGVEELLKGMQEYALEKLTDHSFGAKVYKIGKDDQGNRLTYLKVTSGSLKAKTLIKIKPKSGEELEEKADQVRLYNGAKFKILEEAQAGTVCAVTGLKATYPGQGLGTEKDSDLPVLESVLSYQVIPEEGADPHKVLLKLYELEEEEPELHVVWKEDLQEIHVRLMGEVQLDIIKNMMQKRYGMNVTFGPGSISYKETIKAPVEGVGHYEPLRHYAHVQLLLEPLERGSGLWFHTDCSEDVLDKNWQRLILTHLQEKEHKGVLTGAPITDLKITLLTGKAHQKHTEGGDFRQATYRAVRQALKKAESILLEPYYEFRMELPTECVGKAMTDIKTMRGSFEIERTEEETTVLTGNAPVAEMQDYDTKIRSYTKGRGRLFLQVTGYEPCENQEEIVSSIHYDSEADLENTPDSVFCAHGAGFIVKWYEVEKYLYLDSKKNWEGKTETSSEVSFSQAEPKEVKTKKESWYVEEDKEFEAIMLREFGEKKLERHKPAYKVTYEKQEEKKRKKREYEKEQLRIESGYAKKPQNKKQEKYLLVDGYNIIFAWEELSLLAKENLEAARGKLMDLLCNYQAYTGVHLILVFDAYRVKGNLGTVTRYHNIHVIYTKEAETADMFIEKTTKEIAKKHQVVVATSDALEQMIIMGHGAIRLSASAFWEELERINELIQEDLEAL